MNKVVVVDSVRSGITKSFRGRLRDTRPDDLAAYVINALLARHNSFDPQSVDDCIIGCAFPEGAQGMNTARNIAALSALSVNCSGTTVNRYCASGLQAIAFGAGQILSGNASALVAGGVESISMTLKHINTNHLYNQRIQQDIPGIYLGMDIENPATEFIKNVFNSMGQTAEIVAKKYGISRVAQDEYALLSQQRIAHAQTSGYFSSEIIPFPIQRQKKASTEIDTYILNQDECNKPDTNLENLLALSPSFVDGGTATAGNSSQITDGASMCLLASDTFCDQHQLQRLGYFHGMVTAGCAPEEMGAGPLYAVKKLLKQHKLQISDVDLFEMNEAFASTTLYCQQSLRIPMEKLNVCGGAIGLGHPFGMTGSRLVGRILRDLKRLDKRLGIVTLCVGGGMGVAALVERA